MYDSVGDICDSVVLYMSSVVLRTTFSLQVLCLSHFSPHPLRSQTGLEGSTYRCSDRFKLSCRVVKRLKVLITRTISSYSMNRNEAAVIRERPAIRLRAQGIEEIDAAAFHPRRRYQRTARSPHA